MLVKACGREATYKEAIGLQSIKRGEGDQKHAGRVHVATLERTSKVDADECPLDFGENLAGGVG